MGHQFRAVVGKLMNVLEGELLIRDARFCLLATRFNERIVEKLLHGAVDTLKRHGAAEADIHIIRAPGAFELPLVAQRAAGTGQYDGLVALGAVIRGATPHFDYICSECASGLSRVSLETGVPIGFGVLTCDTVEQAIERSGTKAGNKGVDAALATIEMVSLLRRVGA